MQAESIVSRYQTVQITTSSPGETLIALYDGLFRFLNLARFGLANREHRARAGEAISKSHAIISEFLVALDPSHAPELCQNLSNIYNFCLERLIEANLKNDPAMIDEVIRVLSPLREGFTAAVKQVAAEGKLRAAT